MSTVPDNFQRSLLHGTSSSAERQLSHGRNVLGRLIAIPRGELFIFALLMIGAKTTLASIAIIDEVAYAIMGFSVFLALLDVKNFFEGLRYAALTLALFLFGVGVSFFTSPQIWPPDRLGIIAVVIAAGSFVVCSQRQIFVKTSIAWYVALFMVAYLAISILTDGLSIDASPRYNFEVFNEFGLQQYVVYSQGVSKIAAMATLPCIYFALQPGSTARRIVLFMLGMLFATNAFMGGARGEFLALVVCIVLMLMRRNQMLFLFVVLATLAALTVMPAPQVDDTVQISRLVHLWQDETLGGRQELFGDALSLMIEEPQCLILGCGFQYFQSFWGLPVNAYPHNYILDFLISIGAPLTILVYVVYFKSIIRYLSVPELQLNAFIVIYLFLVSMKSGTPNADHIFWIFLSLQIMSLRSPRAREALAFTKRNHHSEPMNYWDRQLGET